MKMITYLKDDNITETFSFNYSDNRILAMKELIGSVRQTNDFVRSSGEIRGLVRTAILHENGRMFAFHEVQEINT